MSGMGTKNMGDQESWRGPGMMWTVAEPDGPIRYSNPPPPAGSAAGPVSGVWNGEPEGANPAGRHRRDQCAVRAFQPTAGCLGLVRALLVADYPQLTDAAATFLDGHR